MRMLKIVQDRFIPEFVGLDGVTSGSFCSFRGPARNEKKVNAAPLLCFLNVLQDNWSLHDSAY